MPDPITIEMFERAEINLDDFNHRAHITVACQCLRLHGLEAGTDRMRKALKAFMAAKKIETTQTSGYHETMTVAWMKLLNTALTLHGGTLTIDEFLEQNPYLLCRTLLRLYYSKDLIMSWEARRNFVEPDLAPFPS